MEEGKKDNGIARLIPKVEVLVMARLSIVISFLL